MSGKIGFKDKFRNKFNIGKVARKPLRQEVSALRARAANLPQTEPDVRAVVTDLNTARDTIFGKVKTNQERQASVDATLLLVNKVRPELERLEKAKPDPITYEVKGKKASKDDLRRAKDMLGMLTPLQQSVEAMFKPSKDAPLVLMPPDLGRLDLLGQIETVRVHISQGIVDENRGKELSKEIGAVQAQINAARTFIDESRALIRTCDQQRRDADPVLQSVAGALTTLRQDPLNGTVPQPGDTPLAKAIDELYRVSRPEMGMINPGGLKRASDALTKEVNEAKADPVAYARKCCTGAQQKDTAAKDLEIFDGILTAPLAELYEQSAALGTTHHAMISGAVAVARGKIATGKNPVPTKVTDITDPLLQEINDAIDLLKKQSEALRKRVADAHAAMTTALNGIAGTKDVAFFGPDWLAVDALRTTIEGMMPAKDAALDKATLDMLGAVEPLITKLKSTAEALDPSKSMAEKAKFDLAKADIEKVMKDGAAPAAFLKKTDPKKWKELEDGFAKALGTSGVSRFAEAAKAMTEFKTKVFDAAITAANDLKTSVDAAQTVNDRCSMLYVQAAFLHVDKIFNGEPGLPLPNTQDSALKALIAELQKTPPDKGKLDKLKTDAEAAFKDLDTAEDVDTAAGSSHVTEKAAAEKNEADAKTNKETLQNQYYALDMQFEEAKAMVKQAKGDKNAVKSLDRLMKQAQSEINAVGADKKTMDKPNATMTRIQQRIDLMLAHPEGEANRHLGELPGLYNEFRKTRIDAQGQLQGVLQLLVDYQSQQGPDPAVDDLSDRITEYATRFTVNGDTFAGPIDALMDTERPDAERRKARENIVAGIGELVRGLSGHPISGLLATSPIPGAKGIPRRLLGVLDRMSFTVLTSVES